jgi:hypothetical protein
VQRGTLGLGWTLCLVGALGLLGCGVYALLASGLPLPVKLLACALLLGLALLSGATLRARLRTQALDPYRKVQR